MITKVSVSPKFSRRHYRLMAELLKETYEAAAIEGAKYETGQYWLPVGINMFYDRLVAALEKDNPSCSKAQFAEACVPNQLYHR